MTERFKVRPRQALIRFVEPGLGREVQAGKFCQVSIRTGAGLRAYWAYVNDVSVQFDLMQELDAFAVAPCVMEMMKRMDIDQIQYCCKQETLTYSTDLANLRRFGILKAYPPRGAYWHLPRRYWRKVKGITKYPWVKRVLELRWLEPEVAG